MSLIVTAPVGTATAPLAIAHGADKRCRPSSRRQTVVPPLTVTVEPALPTPLPVNCEACVTFCAPARAGVRADDHGLTKRVDRHAIAAVDRHGLVRTTVVMIAPVALSAVLNVLPWAAIAWAAPEPIVTLLPASVTVTSLPPVMLSGPNGKVYVPMPKAPPLEVGRRVVDGDVARRQQTDDRAVAADRDVCAGVGVHRHVRAADRDNRRRQGTNFEVL